MPPRHSKLSFAQLFGGRKRPASLGRKPSKGQTTAPATSATSATSATKPPSKNNNSNNSPSRDGKRKHQPAKSAAQLSRPSSSSSSSLPSSLPSSSSSSSVPALASSVLMGEGRDRSSRKVASSATSGSRKDSTAVATRGTPLLGAEAVREIQQRLKVKQPLAQIKKFQQEMTLEETRDILPLIDLMGFKRSQFHLALMTSLRRVLEEKILTMSQQKLEALLYATFPFVQFAELRQITTTILNKLHHIPSKVLRHLRDNVTVLEGCSMAVRRQVWSYDKKALIRDLRPLLDKYAKHYTDEWVGQDLPQMLHWSLDAEHHKKSSTSHSSHGRIFAAQSPRPTPSSHASSPAPTNATPVLPMQQMLSSPATPSSPSPLSRSTSAVASALQPPTSALTHGELPPFTARSYSVPATTPSMARSTVSGTRHPMLVARAVPLLHEIDDFVGHSELHCVTTLEAIQKMFVETGNICFCQLWLDLMLMYLRRNILKSLKEKQAPLIKILLALSLWIDRERASKETKTEIFELLTSYPENAPDLGDIGMAVRAPQVTLLLCQSIYNELTRAVNNYVLPRTHTRLIHLTHIVGSGYQIREMLEEHLFRYPGLAAEIVQTTFPWMANMIGEDILYDDAMQAAKASADQSSKPRRASSFPSAVAASNESPNVDATQGIVAANMREKERKHDNVGTDHAGSTQQHDANEQQHLQLPPSQDDHEEHTSTRSSALPLGERDTDAWRASVEHADGRLFPESLVLDVSDVYYIHCTLCLYLQGRVQASDLNRFLQLLPVLMSAPSPVAFLYPTLTNIYKDLLTVAWPTYVRRHEEINKVCLVPLAEYSSLFHLQLLGFIAQFPSTASKELVRSMLESCAVSGSIKLGPLASIDVTAFSLDSPKIRAALVLAYERICATFQLSSTSCVDTIRKRVGAKSAPQPLLKPVLKPPRQSSSSDGNSNSSTKSEPNSHTIQTPAEAVERPPHSPMHEGDHVTSHASLATALATSAKRGHQQGEEVQASQHQVPPGEDDHDNQGGTEAGHDLEQRQEKKKKKKKSKREGKDPSRKKKKKKKHSKEEGRGSPGEGVHKGVAPVEGLPMRPTLEHVVHGRKSADAVDDGNNDGRGPPIEGSALQDTMARADEPETSQAADEEGDEQPRKLAKLSVKVKLRAPTMQSSSEALGDRDQPDMPQTETSHSADTSLA